MKKRILVLLALIMSVLFVSCGSSGDNVKDALNDTSIFSQEEIDYVNSELEHSPEVTSTINSTTMQFSENYSYVDREGNTVSGTRSEKIEKKNGIVVYTYTDSNSSNPYVDYELTIPRVFDDFDSNDYFTSAENTGLSLLLRNNGLDGINTGFTEITPGIISLDILLGSSPNYTYKGKIIKDNNKYYFLDSTGIIGSADTLEALISNTSVKNKLTKVI